MILQIHVTTQRNPEINFKAEALRSFEIFGLFLTNPRNNFNESKQQIW